MAQLIYDRGMVREQTIWPSFLYGMPNTDIETTKISVFGLYANTYLLGHNYLEDIESEELQRLLDIYNSNVSELDADDQNLVLEIASKRYIKAIEIQIKNNILATKTQQLSADEQEYDAKLAALEADREALITKQTQVTLAIDRAELRNKELRAQIQLEELAQDYIDIDIAQKQLEKSKVDLQVLRTAYEGLEIQLRILEVALEFAMVDANIAQLDADKDSINARVASLNLEVDRVSIAQKEYTAKKYEVDNMPSKQLELQVAKDLHITTETANSAALETQEEVLQTAKKADQIARLGVTIADFDGRIAEKVLEETQSIQLDTAAVQNAAAISDNRKILAENETDITDERADAAETNADAAISAAETMATANITSTLTHELGSL